MLKDVVEVRAGTPYRLHLVFEDGVAGDVDLAELVPFTGIFEPLLDPGFFCQARVDADLGTVVWPNGADVDPDVLYASASGEAIDVDLAATTGRRSYTADPGDPAASSVAEAADLSPWVGQDPKDRPGRGEGNR
ncbi:MAG: DUF2442 domain-containing protein [Deferrisomatales bacterium]